MSVIELLYNATVVFYSAKDVSKRANCRLIIISENQVGPFSKCRDSLFAL